MAEAPLVFIERGLNGARFRVGTFPPDGHTAVITFVADTEASWNRTTRLAELLSISLGDLSPEIPDVTILTGKDTALVVVPLRGSFKALSPKVMSNAMSAVLRDPLVKLLLLDATVPRLWIEPMAEGFPYTDPAGIIEVVMAAFDPAQRDPDLPKEIAVSLSLDDLDEKDKAEIFARLDNWTWPSNSGYGTRKAPPRKAATKRARPDPRQSTSSEAEPKAPDPDQKTKAAPADPDPAATETINDAEFRFDRPVQTIAQDSLDRRAIAEAIAQKVTGVWRTYQTPPKCAPETWRPRYPGHPFIVHLAGRWGSGKSSILNFLEELLRADHSVTLPPPPGQIWPNAPKGWTIIEFNAWRQQNSGHAWWALMTAVATQAPTQMGARGGRFRLRDRFWRFNSSWRNWIIGSTAALTLLLLWWAIAGNSEKGLDEVLKAIAAAITAIVGIVAFTGTFAARSKRTAEAIQDLEIDPTAALKKRFENMIAEIHNPVAIFIDDLDRCDAAYVVELLQAMQTVYADVPVLYVVAADRDWLVSAYDQTYPKFTGAISEKGQPLGYLFVKKIFQLSVNVPDLSDADQRNFLKSLLPDEVIDQLSAPELHDIETAVEGTGTLEELVQIVAQQPTDATKRAAGRAALSKLVTEKTSQQVTHLLVETLAPEGARPLMDANPRAITRLVNAYSFRLGYALRAGELGVIGKLPYWSVLDLRYPGAAKRLAEKPGLRAKSAWKAKTEAKHFPEPDEIAPLLAPLTVADIEILRNFG